MWSKASDVIGWAELHLVDNSSSVETFCVRFYCYHGKYDEKTS